MKKLIAVLALLCALIYACGYAYDQYNEDPFVPNHSASLQTRSSHRLSILKSEIPLGKCTGTAIGPHAILTAAHCNEGDAIQVDQTLTIYKIKKVIRDGRDHVIFLLDGPAFYDVQPYETRYPVVGERVHAYGFGGGHYPSEYKTGKVLDEYDPSEVDDAAGFYYFTVPAIPGDSGSAVYGSDGRMVGLVTYSHKDKPGLFSRSHMAGFALNFTSKQIKQAQEF